MKRRTQVRSIQTPSMPEGAAGEVLSGNRSAQARRLRHLARSTGLLLALGGVWGTAMAATLDVEVAGIKEAKGKVIVAVYDHSESYLKKPARAASVDAVAGTVLVTLEQLPPGVYAVSAIQDINDNGKLDSNSFGMPTEPFGFANDASGMFGPPSFDQAKVSLGESQQRIRINLK